MCDRITAVFPWPKTRPANRSPSADRKCTATVPAVSWRCVSAGDVGEGETRLDAPPDGAGLPPTLTVPPPPPHAASTSARAMAATGRAELCTFLCTSKSGTRDESRDARLALEHGPAGPHDHPEVPEGVDVLEGVPGHADEVGGGAPVQGGPHPPPP